MLQSKTNPSWRFTVLRIQFYKQIIISHKIKEELTLHGTDFTKRSK